MKLSWIRIFQWTGILAVLVFVVALQYEVPSEAGMQINAAPESPLSQSLRGYWKLDDGSGTNATDASGNANTLAMTGSPSWTTGNIGPYSLDFSGTAQYLSVADPASGVLDIGDNTDFSITGWFNRDTFANDHTIVAKRNSSATNTDAGYIVWIDAAADKLNFTVGDGGGTASDQYTLASASTFTATGWHQFTVVWDDSLGMQLYIDGKLDNSTTSSTSSIGSLANAVAFRIGAESDAGNPFDGKLDDVRVYGYSLSADQVKKLYNTTAPTQPIDTGLVGHWTFDGPDIQGTTAIDRSSYGNNGTITGATKTIGKLGQGMSFDGSGNYVGAGDASSLDITSNFTLSAWIKGDSFPGGYRYQILSKGSRAGNSYFLFVDVADFSPGNQRFKFGFTHSGSWETVDSSIVAVTGSWFHVTGVFDDSANTLKVYVNGVLSGTTTGVTATPASTSGFSNLTLGAYDNGNYEYIDGSIDDVRIYNRALSVTEIASLYSASK